MAFDYYVNQNQGGRVFNTMNKMVHIEMKEETTFAQDQIKKKDDLVYVYQKQQFMNKFRIINHHIHGCLNGPMDAGGGKLLFLPMQNAT